MKMVQQLRRSRLRFFFLLLMLGGVLQPALGDRLIEAGPEDYREHLGQLGPGDHLRLTPGIYRDRLLLRGTAGAPGRPVVIEGPAEGPLAVFEGRDRGITVSLIDVA